MVSFVFFHEKERLLTQPLPFQTYYLKYLMYQLLCAIWCIVAQNEINIFVYTRTNGLNWRGDTLTLSYPTFEVRICSIDVYIFIYPLSANRQTDLLWSSTNFCLQHNFLIILIDLLCNNNGDVLKRSIFRNVFCFCGNVE